MEKHLLPPAQAGQQLATIATSMYICGVFLNLSINCSYTQQLLNSLAKIIYILSDDFSLLRLLASCRASCGRCGRGSSTDSQNHTTFQMTTKAGWHHSTGQMRRVPSSLPAQQGDPHRIKTMELLHNINDLHNFYNYRCSQCCDISLRCGWVKVVTCTF